MKKIMLVMSLVILSVGKIYCPYSTSGNMTRASRSQFSQPERVQRANEASVIQAKKAANNERSRARRTQEIEKKFPMQKYDSRSLRK